MNWNVDQKCQLILDSIQSSAKTFCATALHMDVMHFLDITDITKIFHGFNTRGREQLWKYNRPKNFSVLDREMLLRVFLAIKIWRVPNMNWESRQWRQIFIAVKIWTKIANNAVKIPSKIQIRSYNTSGEGRGLRYTSSPPTVEAKSESLR